MKNTYTKPAYAHILLNNTNLSSQCNTSNDFVVHYSWQVCPIDIGEDINGKMVTVFNGTPECNTAPDSVEICYLNSEPSNNVFGS